VFQCDVKSLAESEALSANELGAYRLVGLFGAVRPSLAFWDRLAKFVQGGGGLALVPGGQEMQAGLKSYNDGAAAHGLLPAPLEGMVSRNPKGVPWTPYKPQHPVTAAFAEWSKSADADFLRESGRPLAYRYWRVGPLAEGAARIADYLDKDKQDKNAALLERPLGQGWVVLFTVPLGGLPVTGDDRWHNYWEDSSFGLVLTDRVCRYLAGDATPPEVNYFCGQPVQVALASPPPPPPYTLQGPGLTAAETNLKALSGEGRLPVPQASQPGNYTVLDGKGRTAAGFSLNIRAEESQLDRVPAEEVEAVLGKGAVLQVDRKVSLHEALQGLRAPPVELLPWLMMAVLLVLTVESFLANRFYRKSSPPTS
jgi:hypothetical protein